MKNEMRCSVPEEPSEAAVWIMAAGDGGVGVVIRGWCRSALVCICATVREGKMGSLAVSSRHTLTCTSAAVACLLPSSICLL